MPDPIQTGQMVHRSSRKSQGPTLTQQRNALAYRSRRPSTGRQQAMQPREATAEEVAAWRRKSAKEAQARGLSKAEWLNQIYGTGFFRDAPGRGGTASWL